MKAKYKIKHQKHEIHKVDPNGRIVLEEVDVEEFAVKLRMSDPMPAMETLRGEADRYFEQLEGKRGCYIEMPELIDKNKRVTFVSGIAGSGKSVVVKQMTYKWANGELFNEFKVCMTFECRELNYFASSEGSGLKTHKMIVEFLKDKFGFYVKDSKNTLFIVDGFDELYDSDKDDSIMAQLLDRTKSKYQESTIIITGRPHIEDMLKKHGGGNMGGLRKVEIIGLSNEQIDEYIHKFASSDENKEAKIKKVKDSSNNSVKLCHVPQFLNSICCVALLSEETEIRNAAELYSWSTYLMFRQHADKDGSRDKKSPEIFNEYSKVLLVLSKICHELLNKNSIIFDGNIELKFDKIEKGNEFLSSLFVDVSNEFKERKQFKHLTLMEFLSAIYACTANERDEVIKDILSKRSDQVLFFYCQLMSGLLYDGIIKNLFTNALKLEESDAKSFFCNILKLVRECDGDDDELFGLSVDVIMCLMNADVISKQFILSIVNQLSFRRVGGDNSSRKWIEMMKRLAVDFECSNDELKKAFKNVRFGWFRVNFEVFKVNNLNELKYAKYFGSVYQIMLNGGYMAEIMTVRDIRKEIDEINEWVKVKRVRIWNCKLEDKDIDDEITKSSKLEWLWISFCYVTEKGFYNLCKWMITVEKFDLNNIEEMKVEWWNVLGDVIVNAKEKNDGDLALKELEIIGCPLMNDEVKEKVITFTLIHNYSSLIIIICKMFNMEHHLLTLFTMKFKHF